MIDFNTAGQHETPQAVNPLQHQWRGSKKQPGTRPLLPITPDITAAAQAACAKVGIVWKPVPHDGKFHATEADGKGKGNDAGRIKIFPDGEGGVVWNWAGDSELFWAKEDNSISATEREDRSRRIAEERARADIELKEQQAKASQLAELVLSEAGPVADNNSYLSIKGIGATQTMKQMDVGNLVKIIGYHPQAKGNKLSGSVLVLPIQQTNGSISSIEMIDGASLKSALYGGKKLGGYWTDKPLPDGTGNGNTLLIGEGAATVLSCVSAMPDAYGVAAFSCHNLRHVAPAMRERFPNARIVILSDIGNGQEDAEQAAKACNGVLAIPVFPPGLVGSDFNDLHQHAGIKEVTKQLGPSVEAWPEPIPLPDSKPAVKPLDEALIPAPLRGWLLDIAERMQIPPDFSTAATIVALGSIIGRGCGIHPKQHDDWLVVPNLWGAVIGRPSMMKTPATSEAFKPIDRLEIDASSQHQSSVTGYDFDQLINEEAVKSLKVAIKKALSAGDTVAVDRLRDQYRNDKLESSSEPVRRRFFTSDATPEKICHLLNENPRGMLLKRDELIGWLSNLDRDGRENARSMFLEGWNGTGRYSYDTIKDGTIDVEALCLSVFGAITPGRLASYIYQANKGGAGDDGLMQRFQLAVWPDAPADWKMIDRWPDTTEKNRAYAIFSALAGEIPGVETTGNADIPALRFTPDAQVVFNDWLLELENRLRKTDSLTPALESHLAKYRSLMPSLSLIYHLVDVVDGAASGAVSERAALMAVGYCEYLESHALRIYGDGNPPGLGSAQEIIRRIQKGDIKDGQTVREIWRPQWSRLTTSEEVQAGLDILQLYEWLTVKTVKTGGRPSHTISLNPRITPSA